MTETVSPAAPSAATSLATALRDSPCGDLDASWTDRTVRVAGWVHRRRDLGGLFFIDLRDRAGLVQLSFRPDWTNEQALALAGKLGPEDVVVVSGVVRARPPEMVNTDMSTGAVEIQVESLELLSRAAPLPILVAVPPEEELPSEELRLRHRVLDLRRPDMLRNFEIRHRAVTAARAALNEEGFLEVETPFLTRRTPEGARDYLVPSRVHPGEFYALPQSPQIYKQLLMAAGFDRYYQLARCLRDEDLRADRQPEHTQIDLEMSFVEEQDVFAVCEKMLDRVFRETVQVELDLPFRRLTYANAMEFFGSDKPDLRISWRIQDLTDCLTGIGFGIFESASASGGRIRGLRIPGGAALSRRQLDEANEMAQSAGAKGAMWLKRNPDAWSGAPAKFVDEALGEKLRNEHGVDEGDLLFLVAGPDSETGPALDVLRRHAAQLLGAVAEGFECAWITRFPLFEPDPETGLPTYSHNPFCMPLDPTPSRISEEPYENLSHAYDLVVNGVELVSGSIRCHDPELQTTIFRTLGMSEEQIQERFGFLLDSFQHGVPPHGGFGMGLDRLVTLLVGADSIREVIAFPKTSAARGLMEGSPSPVDDAGLAELGLRLRQAE
ncbi:MAG: aspartate--tRNA ligase [Gemmatimonadota bacterium]